jgi:hypothetical protein
MYAFTAAAVAIYAYSTYTQVQNSKEMLKLQKTANTNAVTAAEKQQVIATEAVNKQNAKTPDTGQIQSQNQRAEKSGVGSTMLTGPAGVKDDELTLSKTQLLGS